MKDDIKKLSEILEKHLGSSHVAIADIRSPLESKELIEKLRNLKTKITKVPSTI